MVYFCSSLVPWLFLIMISDLAICNASVWKYVNDTMTSEVIRKGKVSNAQTVADEVADWSNRNRVKLNTDKCKELRISFASVSHDSPPVVIRGECIKVVTDAKLLGVTISSDLSWNAHITEVIKTAAKRLYFLIQLKRARVSQKDLCLFNITCALRYRLCCTYVSLCSACLLNARTRARSEMENANHLTWHGISARVCAIEPTVRSGASQRYLQAYV